MESVLLLCHIIAITTTTPYPENSTLKDSHVNSTNPGFTSGICPTATSPYGWHFVLPNSGGVESTFISNQCTFLYAGFVSNFIYGSRYIQVFLYTPGPDTLLRCSTVVSCPQTVINLSHVCYNPPPSTTAGSPVR